MDMCALFQQNLISSQKLGELQDDKTLLHVCSRVTGLYVTHVIVILDDIRPCRNNDLVRFSLTECCFSGRTLCQEAGESF